MTNKVACSLNKQDLHILIALLDSKSLGLTERVIADELKEYFSTTLREARSVLDD